MASQEGSPVVSVDALRPPSGPKSIILELRGPIVGAAVPALCDRVRTLLATGDVDLVTCDVAQLANPDSDTVDALARLQLTARRLDRSIRLRHVRVKLQDLLVLTGLCEQLPCGTGLPVEAHR